MNADVKTKLETHSSHVQCFGASISRVILFPIIARGFIFPHRIIFHHYQDSARTCIPWLPDRFQVLLRPQHYEFMAKHVIFSIWSSQ